MINVLIHIPDNHDIESPLLHMLHHEGIEYHMTNTNRLLMDIYAYNPKGIIIYYDTLTNDGLETIKSSLEIEYIPTLLIVEDTKLMGPASKIKTATAVPREALGIIMPSLLKQMITFSKNYTALRQGYDTITLMNDEFKHVMQYFLRAAQNYENEILHRYFSTIYEENPFIENIPANIWIMERIDTSSNACWVYHHHDQFAPNPTCMSIQNTQTDYYEFAKETGYSVNYDSTEFSDINTLEQIIPCELTSHIKPKKNIAVVSSNNILLICYDFSTHISPNDMAIIKAIAVHIDSMKTVKYRMRDVEEAFVYTMDALARAAEGKDDVTGHHIKRVNSFSRLIAEALDLEEQFINDIEIAAQMHDVGKINIPESILNKPGRLTDEEFDIIKNHTVYGEDIIGKNKHLILASKIARSHHEKYDGSGYPDGLKGEDIPLEARIVSIADIYDALRSPRSYKPGFTHEESYDIIVNGDGRVEPSHFDPKVLSAFIQVHEDFRQVYDTLKDQ